jgi:hypothetical protein
MRLDRDFHDSANRYFYVVLVSSLLKQFLRCTITAASIFVTLSGPPSFCNAKGPLSICASFVILVPISWVAATLCESLSDLQILVCADSACLLILSARLLYHNCSAMRFPLAHVLGAMVYIDL